MESTEETIHFDITKISEMQLAETEIAVTKGLPVRQQIVLFQKYPDQSQGGSVEIPRGRGWCLKSQQGTYEAELEFPEGWAYKYKALFCQREFTTYYG